MTELTIEVFTSPRCPHCPAAVRATKELMAQHPELEDKVGWKELSVATPEGSRKANEYGIRGVPTIILTDKDGNKGGIVGAPAVKRYYEVVSQML